MSQISPLRIQKGTPGSSPTKANGSGRHLAELSPMAQRRNSPSFNQSTKLLDSPDIDTSPFASKFANLTAPSLHSFWQGRDSPVPRSNENRDPHEDSHLGSKRPSVENLKRANRVSKSNIFALEAKYEYDPTCAPIVERPLASGRPLSVGMSLGLQARNSILDRKRNTETGQDASPVKESPISSAEEDSILESRKSPAPSPTKSAMSQNPRFSMYDPETSIWSEVDDGEERKLPTGKKLHRHAKSVTFNASPPEVNEYEEATPDPSVSADSREGSYDHEEEDDEYEEMQRERGESQDSFDESLEDADKTPVVLPEDWRFMSPEAANTELTANLEDPFEDDDDDANHQIALSNALANARSSPARTDSLNSNGSRRPLPPLPPLPPPSFPQEREGSHDSMEAIVERAATTPRQSHSTPSAAAISKDELRSIGSSRMSLEDRLQLVSLEEQDSSPRKAHDEVRERRLRRKSGLHNSISEREIKIFEDSPEEAEESQDSEEKDEVTGMVEFQPIPKISRDSILRKVRSQKFQEEQASPQSEPMPQEDLPEINPDEPLKSYEESPSFLEGDDGATIKQEEEEIDIHSIPLYEAHPESVQTEKPGMEEDDAESQYSTNTDGERKISGQLTIDEPPTPRADQTSFLANTSEDKDKSHRMSLSALSSGLGNDFGLSLSSYMTPSPNSSISDPEKKSMPAPSTNISEPVQRPITPELTRVPGYSDEELREPSTPDSVIRRSLSVDSLDAEDLEQEEVPEPVATVKAPGTKVKIRPSLTPQDVRAMAETRRQVSGGLANVPPIPEKHASRPSMVAEVESFLEESGLSTEEDGHRQVKRKSSLLQLEVPVEEEVEELSFGLDKEFDRVIEYQKKGYLMRQNTKVVVASSGSNTTTTSDDAMAALLRTDSVELAAGRGTRSAGNSPVKKQRHDISGAWTTHEWNGKVRRKSIRQSGGITSELAMAGAVPPLPGLSSVVTGMESLDEVDEIDFENGAGKERGRLFVKVVGIKDLNLPLPRYERTQFALTLDNGMHCVTTSMMELKRNAAIGQEFELVVLNDLEFQLTLQTKLEQPKPTASRPESPSKPSSLKKPGFSRFFGSPKKRKEQELKEEQERLERQRAEQARNPTAWDLQHKLVAKDGSFARAYISLKEHENQAFGRPITVDVPCFNEWTVEENRVIPSQRSGKSNVTMTTATTQRKAPYKIGKLELQLLYVPKTKDIKDEDMPKSMNACIREMQEAEKTNTQTHEGFLSQQGGDCPYWRRRFFRLSGSKLTAFHESTRQPRATINLAKAIKLIDDKTNLKQQTSNKSGGRRKSAFGSEEDGYMFLEEGFRVRFANGETIDFYAENVAQKDEWMLVLADVVGRDSKPSRGWTDIVLKREKALQQLEASERRKASAENRARAQAAASTGGGVVPGPRTSSREGVAAAALGRRPLSQDGLVSSASSAVSSASRPVSARSGGDGPPVPAKDAVPAAVGRKPVMDAAERRAKARSTYY